MDGPRIDARWVWRLVEWIAVRTSFVVASASFFGAFRGSGGLFLLFLLFWLFWWAPAHFYILVSEEGRREEGEEQHGAERGGSQGEAHGHGEWGEREAGIAGSRSSQGAPEA